MTTSYIKKVKRTRPAGLIAYWPLNEESGTVVYDYGPNAYKGTSSGVGHATRDLVGPDGGPCYKFDGAASYVDIYTVQPSQPTTIGSAMLWFAAEKNYLDSTTGGYLLNLAVDANNYISISKTTTANTFDLAYEANNVTDKVSPTIYAKDGNQYAAWHQLVLTWTKAGEAVVAYVDGASAGTSATLGVWSGDLAAATCVIGADNTTVTSVLKGYLAHVALWSVVLSADEVAELYRIGP
jgi:hypothetical protein